MNLGKFVAAFVKPSVSNAVVCRSDILVKNTLFQNVAFMSTKPLRPGSSFILYCQEKRSTKPKTMTQTEFIKAASDSWKHMSENDKQPYVQKYRALMENYKVKMDEFKNDSTDLELEQIQTENQKQKLARQKRRKNKEEKNFNKPKRPLTGYQYYLKTQIPRYIIKSQEQSRKAISCIAADWSKMSDGLKARYNNRVEPDKERYKKDMDEYVKRLIEAKREDLIPAGMIKSKQQE